MVNIDKKAVFTRTPGGLAEKWRFHDVPTIWVEGDTDKYFYKPILNDMDHRIESFDGSENSKELIRHLKEYNHPYIVALDGDYSILRRSRSPHRHVIILPRYSIENFLWEPNAINKACLRHTLCSDEKDLVITSMESVIKNIETELYDAIVLDVAARRMKSPPAVLPKKIESLLKDGKNTGLKTSAIKNLVQTARTKVDAGYEEKAKRDVLKFLSSRCMSHLIKGHLLFGLLRLIFLRAAKKETTKKKMKPALAIHNSLLLQLLSDAVWSHCKSGDHYNLKKKLRGKLRKLTSEHYPKKA